MKLPSQHLSLSCLLGKSLYDCLPAVEITYYFSILTLIQTSDSVASLLLVFLRLCSPQETWIWNSSKIHFYSILVRGMVCYQPVCLFFQWFQNSSKQNEFQPRPGVKAKKSSKYPGKGPEPPLPHDPLLCDWFVRYIIAALLSSLVQWAYPCRLLSVFLSSVYHIVTIGPPPPPFSCQHPFLLVLFFSPCLLHFPVPLISKSPSLLLRVCNGSCHPGGCDEGRGGVMFPEVPESTRILLLLSRVTLLLWCTTSRGLHWRWKSLGRLEVQTQTSNILSEQKAVLTSTV